LISIDEYAANFSQTITEINNKYQKDHKKTVRQFMYLILIN